jgi:hypothetical protein
MSYNFTVQQELGHQFVLDLAYVGNLGRQIPAGYNLSAPTRITTPCKFA